MSTTGRASRAALANPPSSALSSAAAPPTFARNANPDLRRGRQHDQSVASCDESIRLRGAEQHPAPRCLDHHHLFPSRGGHVSLEKSIAGIPEDSRAGEHSAIAEYAQRQSTHSLTQSRAAVDRAEVLAPQARKNAQPFAINFIPHWRGEIANESDERQQ